MPHPKDVVKWWVFYENESFSSDGYEWNTLPKHGVQVVLLQYRDGSFRMEQGDDFYWHNGDVFAHTSNPIQVLEKFPEVKFGGWVSDKKYVKIIEDVQRIIGDAQSNFRMET